MNKAAQPAVAKALARQGVYDEAYLEYVEEVNLRRTQFIGKRTIFRLEINSCGPSTLLH